MRTHGFRISQTTFFELIGRLSPGASPALAQQQLRVTMAALIEQYPEINADYEASPPTVYPGIGLPVAVREQTMHTVRLLLGVVSVLLLIACANVANLLLFRGVSRQGEVAVRRALGASTGRLVRQQVMEGVLLSVLGGAAGVGVSIVLARMLEGQSLLGLPPVEGLSIDWRVLGFAFSAALLTGLVFTLAPAHAAARTNVAIEARSRSRSSTSPGTRLRGALTVVQIAASLTLLVGALLLVRTVRNIDGVDVGFDADAVHAFGYSTSPQGYDADAAVVLRQRLLADVAALPGIHSASIASFLPMPGDRPI